MTAPPKPVTPSRSFRAQRHSLLDDLQALATGTLFVALGVALFKQVGLVTGGTVGLAFLLHYASGWPFGLLFFAINLPFYWLAYRRMGRAFTLKTLTAVTLMAVLAETLPRWLSFGQVHPWFAAVAGGVLIGAGMLILFRHRASLGGFNTLVLYLQERRGWRAGITQAVIDGSVIALSLTVVAPQQVLLSLLGMAAMNASLAINHRPGRYLGL